MRTVPTTARANERTPQPRIVDIEVALSWAYCGELPKEQHERSGPVRQTSPMFRMVNFGCTIDNWSREPGFPAALGEPHPDALTLGYAVQALGQHEPQFSRFDLAAGMRGFPLDVDRACRRAWDQIIPVVMAKAKLQARPDVPDRPVPKPVRDDRGRIVHLLPVNHWQTTLAGKKVSYPGAVRSLAMSGGQYRTGSYAQLRYEPSPESVLTERAEYAAWWLALDHLAGLKLSSMALSGPRAPMQPWLGEIEAARDEGRVLPDLAAERRREEARAARLIGRRRAKARQSGDGLRAGGATEPGQQRA